MLSPASSTICGTPGARKNAKVVFGDMYRHFWDKWSALADKSIFGAAERFFAELSENNQKLLVERAVTLYDGRAFRKEPDDSDILVCKECGSRQLEIQAWINANTDERISYVHDDNNGLWCDGKWCEECGVQVFFCTKAEFTQKMQGWWESCGFETKEQITGLKVCDSPPSENTQTFIDAADQWWNSRDYEHKREIYNRYNSKTNNMQINIIEQISNSCSCSHMEAQEYLDSEIRYLRELQEADDLREDDIEMACSNLGLDLDNQEYFINRLAGHKYL